MADTSIFLQNSIFTSFLLPFLLIFFILFAILEKTKLLGEGRTQINALISFVIGLIFVAAFNYSGVVNNIVLFAVIAIVILFIALLMWTFLSGEGGFWDISKPTAFRTILLIGLFIAIIIGVIWAFGIPISTLGASLFSQAWSQPFWTNFVFILLIGIALALVMRSVAAKKG